MPGGGYSRASGLNNAGQIVGYADTASNAPHAFLDSHGVMTDLNSLLDPSLHLTLSDAFGINDRGQIAARDLNGHAYLLTPVPEPGTWLLLGAGLLLLGGRAAQRTGRARSGATLVSGRGKPGAAEKAPAERG